MTTLFGFYKILFHLSFLPMAGPATEVSGTILDKSNNTPVSNVYVYAVKGEEETLSEDNGRFKLLSWSKLPVIIFFEKKGYKPARIPLNREQKNIRVVLEPY